MPTFAGSIAATSLQVTFDMSMSAASAPPTAAAEGHAHDGEPIASALRGR